MPLWSEILIFAFIWEIIFSRSARNSVWQDESRSKRNTLSTCYNTLNKRSDAHRISTSMCRCDLKLMVDRGMNDSRFQTLISWRLFIPFTVVIPCFYCYDHMCPTMETRSSWGEVRTLWPLENESAPKSGPICMRCAVPITTISRQMQPQAPCWTAGPIPRAGDLLGRFLSFWQKWSF